MPMPLPSRMVQPVAPNRRVGRVLLERLRAIRLVEAQAGSHLQLYLALRPAMLRVLLQNLRYTKA